MKAKLSPWRKTTPAPAAARASALLLCIVLALAAQGEWSRGLAARCCMPGSGFASLGFGMNCHVASNLPAAVVASMEPSRAEASGASKDSLGASGGEKDHWARRGGRIAVSILGRAALYVALLAGLVLIPLGLGGTFVMVGAAALFGLLTGFEQITLRLLAVLLGLALLGEGVESVLGVAMARRYGASKWGMWGAFLGGMAGAVLGTPVPVVGNLIGALIGVFVGAFALEWIGRGRSDSSLKAGWGALVGRTAAAAVKLALGMVIAILVVARTLG